MKGTITVWSETRGFGFIQPDGTTEIKDRLFVHSSNFDKNARPGLGVRVEFSIGNPFTLGKKPQAVNAVILPEPGVAALAGVE